MRVDTAKQGDLAACAERYRCGNTELEVVISGSQMRTIGRFGHVDYALEGLGGDIRLAKSVTSAAPFLNGMLDFGADGFRLWTYCATGLPMRRV